MYESRTESLLTGAQFAQRVALHLGVAGGLLVVSLALGMGGYMYFEDLEWRDAFLNSSMLLGGMGPVDPPQTDGGKLFAGLYALYAGVLILVTAGVVLTPVLHRLMHRFHLETEEDEKKAEEDEKK